VYGIPKAALGFGFQDRFSVTLHPPLKTILVTGAGDRLGLAIAQDLAGAGYHVVLHANSKIAQAQAAAEGLRQGGHRAVAIAANLLDHGDVVSLIERASSTCGEPIDGLVNNASIFEGDTAHDFTNESWDRHFDMHVRAPCELARTLAMALPSGQIGSVVNIIDQRVFKLTPQFFTYTLSKAALATATKTLAQALAPHVRVNGVAPGPVARNLRQSEEDFQKQVDATLLGCGSPTPEIVDAVRWLLEAQSVTGQVVAVDGGQSLIWRTPDVDGIVE
jgi:NAD(P)-dependent dehydrogenase (short-subunit alcohol dehydrogenase family)